MIELLYVILKVCVEFNINNDDQKYFLHWFQLDIVLETPSLPLPHSVGDLVWAKVSGYPWWPCMVTSDPEFNSHFKHKLKSESSDSRFG